MREEGALAYRTICESGFCVWCFFAASGVKTDFSTSSYVEKIVTIKKTKNTRFFVLKRAVLLLEHCTSSVPKGAQILKLVCTPRIPACEGALRVQCSKRNTAPGVILEPLFCLFFADISYTEVQCASQSSKNTPTPTNSQKNTQLCKKKQKKISHNSAARQCQQRSGAKPIKPPSPG